MQFGIMHISTDNILNITSDDNLIISCFDQTISTTVSFKTPVYY
jgi:hypothetical protein